MSQPQGGFGALLAVALLLAPTPSRAQVTPGHAPASFEVSAGMRLTPVRSETSLLLGGSAILRPRGRFFFGGSGWMMSASRRIDGGSSGSGLRLRMAYGGLDTRVLVRDTGGAVFRVGAVWGVGNATLSLPAVGADIASDNFLVFEPSSDVSLRLVDDLTVVLTAGFRFVAGVEDLPGVSTEHLRGVSAGVGLSWAR